MAGEFASIGVRFGYILNAGGLVAVPAIMELLPETPVDRSTMIWPALLFAIGILSAAVTNYLAYLSSFKTGVAWTHELNARARETSATYYPPEDTTESQLRVHQYRSDHAKVLKSANLRANMGIAAFGVSILLFLAGVFDAIWEMIQLQ